MKRTDAIAYMRIAGYHNDLARWTRLFIENRVGREAANLAWVTGKTQKQRGMKCTCTTCNPTTTTTK